MDEDSIAKTQDIRWNAMTDSFYFLVEELELKSSYIKREVLSTIAKLFDQSGWLTPTINTTKVLMQTMWLDKIDWDDNIPRHASKTWLSFISIFKGVNEITIFRWVNYSPSALVKIHGFCDASELAYAAAIYTRIELEEEVFTNLLIAKTKVAPVKKPSKLHLELCGTYLLWRLIQNLRKESLKENCKYHSHSTIV